MISIGLFILSLALTTIDAQGRCPDRRATCINIRECPAIIEILRRPRPLSAESLQILRDVQCGFEGNDPLVCCVNEGAPIPTPSPTPAPTPAVQEVQPSAVPDPPNVSNHPNLSLLDHESCGPISQQRVINGNKTGIFDYPWMALIAYDTGRGTEFRCGGTIINKRYVLTAAHCVTSLPGGLRVVGVRVGDHDVSKERECEVDEDGLEVLCAEKYQELAVDSIHFHPEYNPFLSGRTRLQNDIALIRLNNTMDFRPTSVKAICLPFGTASILQKSKAVVTGWGATDPSGSGRSQDLLQAILPIVDNEQCKETYRRTAQIWYKQMCAGGHNHVDSCLGDSGGPLQSAVVYNNGDGRIVQYGIVSYGLKQCGTNGYPGVYTNVAYYMDWILDTLRP